MTSLATVNNVGANSRYCNTNPREGMRKMAESKIICVTCQRDFPNDLDADKSPRYLCQGPLLPKSDDAFDFASEVQRMLWYIQAIAEVTRYGENKDIEEST